LTLPEEGVGSATLIVLDTETTGLDHKSERLLEVAAVKLENGEVVETFTSLVNPQVPIRHSSFQIHGISEEMVKDAPTIDEVLPRFLEFINELPFVAHNAIFDYSFINEAHKTLYNKRWKTHKIDTLEMYRSVFPDEPSHGLASLLARFGFEPEVKHRALDDAICLANCYPKLRALYEQRYRWQLDQLQNIEYLVERYLRMQKAIQIMQSEMGDLKEIFKIYFTEGGRPIEATTGELMVSSTLRTYEYEDDLVWPILLNSGLVHKGARLNPRYLDKMIDSNSTEKDIREQLKEARVSMHESRMVNFVKPQPIVESPNGDKPETTDSEGAALEVTVVIDPVEAVEES
jgi:DNA polymerase III epsilon subunit family exonuclease